MANVTYNIMMGLRKRAFNRRAQQQQRQQQQEKSESTFPCNLNNYSDNIGRFLILSFSAVAVENPPVVPVDRYSLARVERDLNEMWPSLAQIPRYGITLHAQTGF